mmetsp:Transcript_16063/g.32260  ORF Transcript_16063/g.32260 Transcript_16063/m.32260 type:complete len:94 (-) Transcript_16063:782-1063(-)
MHWATTKNNAPRAPSADKEIIAPNPGDEYDKQRRRRWNQWIMAIGAIRMKSPFVLPQIEEEMVLTDYHFVLNPSLDSVKQLLMPVVLLARLEC